MGKFVTSKILVKIGQLWSPSVMHIVDELILERATKLQSMTVLWRLIKPTLYAVLGYKGARKTVDIIAQMSGFDAFAEISRQLNLQISETGAAHIPAKGRCVLICNHPTGLADGIAVLDLLRIRRPDMLFMANADALRVVPNGEDIIIPVEWVLEKRTREKTRLTLSRFRQAMSEERCVVIFPAGSLAYLSMTGLVERPWESSATSLARKYDAPILPVNIHGRNSILYYLFCLLNTELRDITLFHELMNKQRSQFQFTIGPAVNPNQLPKGSEQATSYIRQIVTDQLAILE